MSEFKYGDVLKLKKPPFEGYADPNRWMVIGLDSEDDLPLGLRDLMVIALTRGIVKSIPYSDLDAYTLTDDD